MNADDQANFFYLNRDDRWLDFKLYGLALGEDGTLRLASLPLLEGSLPEQLAQLAPPIGPAGIAVSPEGIVYFSDPSHHRVLKIDACDGLLSPLPCLGGEGHLPTQLSTPRGVLFYKQRRALFIADSDNHRIQIFDPDTFQLTGIWGQPDYAGEPQASPEPGRFDTPWSLASDSDGNVYVADFGNRRVQKFDLIGRVIKSFAESVQESLGTDAPSEVAVGMAGSAIEIYVLVPSAPRLLVFDPEGQLLRSIESSLPGHAMGLAVCNEAIYIGDNDSRRLLKFKTGGNFVGQARGYEGPVAALAHDDEGNLLIHAGGDLRPMRLAPAGAYIKGGLMWGGPFGDTTSRPKNWYRLKAIISSLSEGTHLRLFTYASNSKSEPPVNPDDAEPFAAAGWNALPMDSSDGLVNGDPTLYLWVGAQFGSEGLATPALSQMRLDFNHQGYLQYFPAIYRDDPRAGAFWAHFLSLFENFFGEVEERIADLSRLFDPAAVPAEFLQWLAGWLSLDVDERWTEEKKRQAIAGAFALYAERGTAEGLRKALRFFAGIEARIEEPILHTAWWSLPADETATPETSSSLLGFTTRLAPAEAQGAVVGTSAALDQSHLITAEEFGAPLFEDVAHQFVVQIHQSPGSSEKKLDEVRALIEREKPAHTTYHLCVINPSMRIGFQSRIGIDTVVAGPSPPTQLEHPSASGALLILGGAPPARMGDQSRVGKTTHIGVTKPEA
ncbi:MAG: phage tail protein I [Pyrinomonadaceae bacterium]